MVKVFEQNPKVTCTTTDYKEDANSFREIDKKTVGRELRTRNTYCQAGWEGGLRKAEYSAPSLFLQKTGDNIYWGYLLYRREYYLSLITAALSNIETSE